MSSLLFISYSRGLSKAEIDKSVFENRKIVIKFVKKVGSKVKVVTLHITLGMLLVFSRVEATDAMGLVPMPQSGIVVRDNRIESVGVSKVRLDAQKEFKITFIKPRDLPLCIYMMDNQFTGNPEISKLIKQIRGGALPEAVMGLVMVIMLWQILKIKGFQIPVVHPNGARLGPANGGIQRHLHHQKGTVNFRVRMSDSKEVSTNVVQTQTQMSGFVKNGKVDLNKCLAEVRRRCQNPPITS